ncbi:hypothetical protein KUTeg_004385 [Tegillarca granosa]|uniref:Uncharacterized protein n=1 Tax=Tegillarca granosa TaxID=220873 RepID=A0ABQ9FPS5_TEGGR|nr:hypothetical protein KUTeg_004385 [Tegillarca granosa]
MASILKLMQTVIMETGYGPIGGLVSGEPDLLDNGKHEPKRASQESFTEFMARSAPKINGPVVHRRADRHYSKRMRRRLVYKNGEVNITQTNIRKRRRRFLADIFTTLVDIKWRYNLLLFAMAFVLSWLIFAVIWYLICFSHGDLVKENQESQHHIPCVKEIKSFTSALLFSIETQHTIGYGSRHTTEECAEAITVMMIQSCFGVICQAMMTGIVFAKLSRPKKRAETLMFSKNACVCKQDGDLCLLLRVGDMRKSHIVEAHVRAVVIKKKITKEGEVLPLHQFDVNLGYEDGLDRLFLVWPVIIVHKINEDSPFFEMSPEDLHREQFELIVILEGIVESTGMTTQARSSYLPGEILWGHRFERLVTFQKENGQYEIDFSRFHNTMPIETPQCSAKELAEIGDIMHDQTFVDDDDNTSVIISESYQNTCVEIDKHYLEQYGCQHATFKTNHAKDYKVYIAKLQCRILNPFSRNKLPEIVKLLNFTMRKRNSDTQVTTTRIVFRDRLKAIYHATSSAKCKPSCSLLIIKTTEQNANGSSIMYMNMDNHHIANIGVKKVLEHCVGVLFPSWSTISLLENHPYAGVPFRRWSTIPALEYQSALEYRSSAGVLFTFKSWNIIPILEYHSIVECGIDELPFTLMMHIFYWGPLLYNVPL